VSGVQIRMRFVQAERDIFGVIPSKAGHGLILGRDLLRGYV
jgi:hypothetical protein